MEAARRGEFEAWRFVVKIKFILSARAFHGGFGGSHRVWVLSFFAAELYCSMGEHLDIEARVAVARGN